MLSHQTRQEFLWNFHFTNFKKSNCAILWSMEMQQQWAYCNLSSKITAYESKMKSQSSIFSSWADNKSQFEVSQFWFWLRNQSVQTSYYTKAALGVLASFQAWSVPFRGIPGVMFPAHMRGEWRYFLPHHYVLHLSRWHGSSSTAEQAYLINDSAYLKGSRTEAEPQQGCWKSGSGNTLL